MRIEYLRNSCDYRVSPNDRYGRFLLSNVTFESGIPESIRLNVTHPNSSFRRAQSGVQTFPHNTPPFELLAPSMLFSMNQLSDWQANFAIAHDAIGEVPLGKIKTKDPSLEQILSRFQARAFELAYIDHVLGSQSFQTPLYSKYRKVGKQIELSNGGEPNTAGQLLLEQFEDAASTYAQVPELLSYFDQHGARAGELGPRGRQFQEWFSNAGQLAGIDGVTLEYVAHELRPLRMSGSEFRWNQNEGDLRMLSVDLLCRYRNHPVWCELKMDGDSWTSSALVQVLLYGSMLCSSHQQRRCRRFFSPQFSDFRPWLGIIVEQREDDGFLEDFESALAFTNSNSAREVFQHYINGFLFLVIRPADGCWEIGHQETVVW